MQKSHLVCRIKRQQIEEMLIDAGSIESDSVYLIGCKRNNWT